MLRAPGLQGFGFLARDLPGFRVTGNQVKIIQEPSQFYGELLRRSGEARKRVVVSALYLGTGKQEKEMVEALRQNLVSRAGLRVKVLLDWCRGSRLVAGESSKTMLAPLKQGELGDRCNVSLYHTPHLRGMLKKVLPQRWNETVGLQHCKVYVFDDSVIISGANLSNDYFSNRQDRYLVVEDCPGLADYYEECIDTIGRFSLNMDSSESLSTHPSLKSHPYQGKLKDFVAEAGGLVKGFLESQKERNIVKEVGEGDTLIFPTMQCGQLGIRQDSDVTAAILAVGEQGAAFHLGSGYFNLTESYCHALMHHSKADCQILMAHPSANGFLGARGPAGGIPHAYTAIAKGFWSLLVSRGLENRIRMHEYQRQDWTFHAKGLWYSPPGQQLPALTMVGSPNFGCRSVERDLETQLVIVTEDPGLRTRLGQERDSLFQRSSLVTEETWTAEGRSVPRWVSSVVGLARNFF